MLVIMAKRDLENEIYHLQRRITKIFALKIGEIIKNCFTVRKTFENIPFESVTFILWNIRRATDLEHL